MKDILALSDYRRQIAALYARVRQQANVCAAFEDYKSSRDQLFAEHSQSALNQQQRQIFKGLDYFPYNPAYRFLVKPIPISEANTVDIKLRDDGIFHIRPVAHLPIPFPEAEARLTLYWIEGYGGGLFLPFGDATNDVTSYGGGRYLLDTIKHADLGSQGDKLVLDFNFAYNPSCAYNSNWDCPLAPYENRLEMAVEVGERGFEG